MNARNKTRFHSARRAAFTLLELILVMSLLAIVMAVAAPSLSGFFKGRTLDSEARRLLSLTRYAQSRAVSEGVPVQLWIDGQNRTYGLQADPAYVPGDAKAVQFEFAPDVQVEVLASQVAVRSSVMSGGIARADTTSIRFQPDGFIADSSLAGVRLRGADDTTVAITQSSNRLQYAIQTDAPR
jgi:type II secretion system protein H